MSQFVELEFENAGEKTTIAILEALTERTAYEHTAGQNGNLVGWIGDTCYATFADVAEDIVHEFNDGRYCGIELLTESQVEHLL